MVGNFLVGLDHFSLSLSLNLEQVNIILIRLVLYVSPVINFLVSCVVNVLSDDLVFRTCLFKCFDLKVKSLVDIVNWVYLLLLKKSC